MSTDRFNRLKDNLSRIDSFLLFMKYYKREKPDVWLAVSKMYVLLTY